MSGWQGCTRCHGPGPTNADWLCADCAPPPQDSKPKGGRRLLLTPASRIKSQRVRWLWRDWIALRSLAVLAGEAGLGKSTLSGAWLAAQITRGRLDGELDAPADVLIVSAEDDWGTVIKPRLVAHGADLDRVHRINVEDGNGECTFTLPDDVGRLDDAIEGLRVAGRSVALVILDPIGSFLSGSTDTHKESPVRRALAPLAALAMSRDLVTLAVGHLNKDESQRLLSRVSGAGAFGNAPRSVIGFARDPEDPDGDKGYRRVIVHAKSNWGRYATSLAARVDSRLVPTDDGEKAETGQLVVTGESSIGIDDLRRGRDEHGADCEEAIGAALADGERPGREVKSQVMDELGCSRRTVERAATRMHERDEIAIEKGGFQAPTTWALASRATPTAPLPIPPGGAVGEPRINTGVSSNGASNRANRATDPARGATLVPSVVTEGTAGGDGGAIREPTCGHPAHRSADWRMPGARMWICGECRPPGVNAGVAVWRNGASA